MLLILYALILLVHGLLFVLYGSFAKEWWPRSWLLAGRLDPGMLRVLVLTVLSSCAFLFSIAALGLVMGQPWFRDWLTAGGILSTLSMLTFWDGQFNALDEKGLVGILINIALLIAVYVFKYPAF